MRQFMRLSSAGYRFRPAFSHPASPPADPPVGQRVHLMIDVLYVPKESAPATLEKSL